MSLTLRTRIPRHVYQVIELWDDGEILTSECRNDWISAQARAANIYAEGREFIVTLTTFSANGYPVAVADVTAEFAFDDDGEIDVIGNRADEAWLNSGDFYREAAE